MNTREIEFRAWDKINNRMLQDVSIGTLTIWHYSKGEEDIKAKSKDCIFMQYTGLKDKNGKKIFNGDIVKIKDNFVGKVDFCFGVYRIFTRNAHIFILGIDIARSELEIIGNIYQNEDLLTK